MFRFVFGFYFLTSTSTFGININGPMNVAVGNGEATHFNCTCNSTSFKWVITKDGSLSGSEVADVTDRNCVVLNNFTSTFRTEKPGANTCNLVVVNASTSLGGYYACFEDTGADKSSQAVLIVIDKNPTIGHNFTNVILPEENLAISISVLYGGPSLNPPVLAPSFNWTLSLDPSEPIPSYSNATTDTSWSWIVVRAEAPDIPSYSCTLFFRSPVHSPTCSYCAANAPNYRNIWSTNSLPVSYPSVIVNVTQICLEKDKLQLSCYAVGYPTSSYTWTDLIDGSVISFTSQAIIKCGGDGIYRCNATNTIRNIIYIEFQDINTTECTYPKSDSSASDETAEIVLGVLFAISFLVNIGLIIWIVFLLRINQENTSTGGMIINPPINVAVGIGGTADFTCTCDNSNFKWIHSKYESPIGNGAFDVTYRNCTVLSNSASNFRTEVTGPNSCNLIVFNATTSHGGYYTCYQDTGPDKAYQAILIVLDENPSFDYNVTNEIVSGETLIISNTVWYGGPSLDPPVLPPLLNWTLQPNSSDSIIVATSSDQTINTSTSSIAIRVQPPYTPSYVSTLSFKSPRDVSGSTICAPNAPTYRQSWSTASMPVSYPAGNLSLTVDPQMPCLENTMQLHCSAVGYPQPTYTWTNLTDDQIISNTDQATIKPGQGGIYRCNATNTIRNIIYTQFQDINAKDCIIPEPLLCENLGLPDDACIVILVIVSIVSLNIISTFVFLLLYGLNEDFPKRQNERFEWMKKMLPCFNKDCDCSAWIVAFIAMSIVTGFIAFPVLIMMAYCSCCNEDRFKDKSNSSHVSASEFTDVTAIDPPQGAYESLRRPNPELSTGQGALVYEELTTTSGSLSNRNRKSDRPQVYEYEQTIEPTRLNEPYEHLKPQKREPLQATYEELHR